MNNKWHPDKDRLLELEAIAAEYARGKGLESLRDSISGAGLAIMSLNGHLLLTDDKLNESEWTGLVIAAKFLEILAERNKSV